MERYIGHGYTNNKGIAKLEYDETGTQLTNTGVQGYGKGELDLKAKMHKDSTTQSEPYTVWDTLMYDNGGTDVSKWDTRKASSFTITYPNSEYTLIANTNAVSTSSTFLLSSVSIIGDFEAILEVIIPSYVSNVGQYFGVRSTDFTKQTIWRATETSWRYYKIRRVNGEWSGFVKVNESDNWQTISPQYNQVTNENINFSLTVYNPSNSEYAIGFKNLKIYSI